MGGMQIFIPISFFVAVVWIVNILVDVVYVLLDPRVRVG